MSEPRIAICTAAVGCGHTRAAVAVRDALLRERPGCVAEVVEALEFAPGWFVRSYRDGYLSAIARVPRMAGWMYARSDRLAAPLRGGKGRGGVAGGVEHAAMRGFIEHESVANADVIVTTHFLCARVLGRMRERGMRTPLAVCITDQHPHGVWLAPGADVLMVASEEAHGAAVKAGVDAGRVRVVGIPIDAEFGAIGARERGGVRAEFGWPEDRRVALVSGGGLGLGGMGKTVRAMMASRGDIHVVVVCGKNERLRRELEPLARGVDRPGPSCEVFGYRRDMARLMGAADVLVGKPGGLTTAEATASGLPMVLLRPIPGQEERNAARLVAGGAAVLRGDPAEAGRVAAELLMDKARLVRMRSRAVGMGRADAAGYAARVVLEMWEGSGGRRKSPGPGERGSEERAGALSVGA